MKFCNLRTWAPFVVPLVEPASTHSQKPVALGQAIPSMNVTRNAEFCLTDSCNYERIRQRRGQASEAQPTIGVRSRMSEVDEPAESGNAENDGGSGGRALPGRGKPSDHRGTAARRATALRRHRPGRRPFRGGRTPPGATPARSGGHADRRRDRPAPARLHPPSHDRPDRRGRRTGRGRQAVRSSRSGLRRHVRRLLRPVGRGGLRGRRAAPRTCSTTRCARSPACAPPRRSFI